MPLYTTGGTDDSWFEMSKTAHKSWSTLNECSTEEPMAVLTLSGGKLSVARKFVNSSCKNNVKVVRLEIVNGTHVQDSRMAKLSYDSLKSFLSDLDQAILCHQYQKKSIYSLTTMHAIATAYWQHKPVHCSV